MTWQTIHKWWFDIKTNSKSQLDILGPQLQLFEKQSKKSGQILYTEKKRRMSE